MYPHSRRRRQTEPPSPLRYREYDHDDYFRPSDPGFDLTHGGRYCPQSRPPPPRTSLDIQRRPSVPVDHVEDGRGRRPTRQPAYTDLRSSRGHDAGAVSPPAYAYDYLPRARMPPRSHSQGRPHTHDRDGSRGRPPPSRHSRGSHGGTSSSRSKSVSSSSHHERQSEKTGTPWWQNPVLRTCALTALSTGLAVALDSRGDPGQWKGAKGAKVAVATVGSAVVDGFLGQKHPNGLRHTVMKKGMEVAMDEAEKKKHRAEDKADEEREPNRRSRSTRTTSLNPP
ncbi:hypothetical protein E4U41_003120 [Claviceps citrina]|nr:hypothetical protein E4U41_003120 [Claviceps citrina]